MTVQKNPDTKLWETRIDGKLFEFEKYRALEATQLLFDLGTITGKPLGGLAGKAPASAADAKASQTSTFAMVVEKLADALTSHRDLALRLLTSLSSGERIMCNGVKVGNYDTFYADDLMLAFDVARANLEVQFGNFFGAASKRLGLNLGAEQARLADTTSNG